MKRYIAAGLLLGILIRLDFYAPFLFNHQPNTTMAKKVERWEAADGSIHATEILAIQADVRYWKARAETAEGRIPVEKHEHRQPYAEKEERGGHQ